MDDVAFPMLLFLSCSCSLSLSLHGWVTVGYMQPIVELSGRKFDKDAELRSTTLANMGLAADSTQPKKVRVKLAHSYTAPVRTDAEKAEIMANFQRRFAEATGEGETAASSSSSSSGRFIPRFMPHWHP